MPAKARGGTHISDTTMTLEKKILLHLLRFHSKREDYEAPLEMSQEGIGKAFDVRQSSISRVITKMLKEELVSERAAYVVGSKQRRKIYYLSHRGYLFAQETKRALEDMIVTLFVDNEPIDIELRRVNEHLTSPMDILDVLRNLGPRGELDASALIKMEPRAGKEPIVFGDPLPKGRTFVGRTKELKTLERWVCSRSTNIIIVHGVAGIGKTALVVKLLDSVKDKDIFYIRIRDWSSLNSILGSIGAFLSRTGRRRLATHIRKDGPIDLKEVISMLEAELRDLDALFIMDDFHSVSGNMRPFFIELIEMLPRTKSHAMMLTRYTEPFYDRSKVVVKGVVKEMRVDGLTKKDCRSVLKDRGLDASTVDRIYKVTGGHPLSLELIGILGDLKEVDKFVFEEIYSTLTSQEKRVLQLTSIMRAPSPLDLLLQVGTSEIVDELERKALINAVGYGYEIQDLLREFFLNRTPPKMLAEMHALALGHYADLDGPRSTIETAYHRFYSGDRAGAIDLLRSKSDQLVQEGMTEEMIGLVDTFGSQIPKERYRDAYNLREKAANLWGTWDNQMEYVFECLLLEDLLGSQLKAPSKALRTSCLGRSAEDTDQAIEDLENTLAILKKVGDEHGICHTHYTLVWIRWIRGEFTKARRDATNLLQMGIDEDLRARTMMLLGGIELEAGKVEDAVNWYAKAQKAHHRSLSAEGEVQAMVFDASAHLPSWARGAGEIDKRALNRTFKLLEGAANKAKDNRLHRAGAYCCLRTAQVTLLAGRPDEAIALTKDADARFGRLHDGIGQAYAKVMQGISMLAADGKMPETIDLFKSALEELGKACLDRMSGIIHLHLEKVYSRSGDTFGADCARKSAEAIGVVLRRR